MLEIVVCVKAVPDPKQASKIRIDPNTKTLTRADVPLVLNQLDRHAVEAALQLKEQEDAIITAISMGPPAAKECLKDCLAMGVDDAVLLSDRAFAGADAYATAFTLAKGIERLGKYDLVICGMESSDGSTAQVGPTLGTFLDLAVVTTVKEIVDNSSDYWRVKANMENGYRLVEFKLPALLTVTRELNKPRNISFSGIVKARKKEILEWGVNDLGVEPEKVGLKGSPTIISELRIKENKRTAEMLEGKREEVIKILLEKLAKSGVL